MSQKILVTGAAGFIGSHLVQYHLEQGDIVIGIDNFSGGKKDNIASFKEHPNFTFYFEDLANWSALTEIIEHVDIIYHLAAMVGMFHVLNAPLETLEINIETTKAVLESMRLVSKPPILLLTSSSEVYGNQKGQLSESIPITLESTIKTHASYCISKMTNEAMAAAYHHHYHLPIIITRLFNTIGPRQTSHYGMVVPRFIQQALNNDPITIFGTGEQTRSFCDVRDSRVLLHLLTKNPKSIGKIVNVGHPGKITINQLAGMIKILSNSQSAMTHTPFQEAYKEGYIQILEREPNVEQLLDLTDYQYHWSLENTLQNIIQATSKGLL